MRQVSLDKYIGIDNSVELYYTFKEDFFQVLDKNLGGWEEVDEIKQWFIDYEFNKIRVLLDKKTSFFKDKLLDCIMDNVSGDRVYNLSYRDWQNVENAFMLFDELYTDLIELNIY